MSFWIYAYCVRPRHKEVANCLELPAFLPIHPDIPRLGGNVQLLQPGIKRQNIRIIATGYVASVFILFRSTRARVWLLAPATNARRLSVSSAIPCGSRKPGTG